MDSHKNKVTMLKRIIRYLLNFNNFFQVQRLCLYEFDFNNQLPNVQPLFKDGFVTVISRPEQFDHLIAAGHDLHLFPFYRESRNKNVLDMGAVFIYVSFGKKPAHLTLVALEGRAALFDPYFRSIRSADTGYIGPCLTLPEYRGKGIYPYVLAKSCEILKQKGKRRAQIMARRNHPASVRGISKAGFLLIAEILCFKLLKRDFYKVKTLAIKKEGVH